MTGTPGFTLAQKILLTLLWDDLRRWLVPFKPRIMRSQACGCRKPGKDWQR